MPHFENPPNYTSEHAFKDLRDFVDRCFLLSQEKEDGYLDDVENQIRKYLAENPQLPEAVQDFYVAALNFLHLQKNLRETEVPDEFTTATIRERMPENVIENKRHPLWRLTDMG